MNTPTISLSLAEKLAIVNTLDSVILADGTVHSGEINAMGQLMTHIDFDSNFIVQARNIAAEQSLSVFQAMSNDKKEALAVLLEDMALADGFVHEKETSLITGIFSSIGIRQRLK